jgi:putative endonuclease
MIQCKDGKLYAGITNDIDRRIGEHNSGNGGRFTRYRIPVKLIYKEPAPDRSSALNREAEIKKLKRREKEELIRSFGLSR